jgi:hypothetical protein
MFTDARSLLLGLVGLGSLVGCEALNPWRQSSPPESVRVVPAKTVASNGAKGFVVNEAATGIEAESRLPEIGRTSKRLDVVAGDEGVQQSVIHITDPSPTIEVVEFASPTIKDAEPSPKKEIANTKIENPAGRAESITKIAGQVQQYRKSWRLRYADIAQEDPYGGVVVLDGGTELSRLHDGQQVRVTGVFVPPETRTSSATFRVKTLEALD